MTKQKTFMLAMAGAALVLASRAQAQFTYTPGDVLLDFRTYTVGANPNTVGANNVEVDLGSAASLVANTASLPSTGTVDGVAVSTVDLDGGGTQGAYSPLFTKTGLYTALYGSGGSPSTGTPTGFSATGALASGPNGADELFLSRTIPAATIGGTANGLTASASQSAATQASTLGRIGTIGADAQGGTLLSGSSSQAVFTSSSDANSYQKQGEQATTPITLENTINFGSSQNTAGGAGGTIETKFTGAGNVYAALWDVPNSDLSGVAPTELGYFTFQTDGEIDFTTTTVSAVPEPATYSLVGAVGMLGLSLRRKMGSLRSLIS